MSVLLEPLARLLPKNKRSYRIYSFILIITAMFAYIFFPTHALPGANFVVMGFALLFAIIFYVLSFSIDKVSKNNGNIQSDTHAEIPSN